MSTTLLAFLSGHVPLLSIGEALLHQRQAWSVSVYQVATQWAIQKETTNSVVDWVGCFGCFVVRAIVVKHKLICPRIALALDDISLKTLFHQFNREKNGSGLSVEEQLARLRAVGCPMRSVPRTEIKLWLSIDKFWTVACLCTSFVPAWVYHPCESRRGEERKLIAFRLSWTSSKAMYKVVGGLHKCDSVWLIRVFAFLGRS